MIALDDGQVISAAQHAAGILEGTAKTNYIGVTKVISVRLPSPLLAELQGFAHKSGKSRNSIISILLEVALEEVKKHASPEALEDLEEITHEHLQDAFPEAL